MKTFCWSLEREKELFKNKKQIDALESYSLRLSIAIFKLNYQFDIGCHKISSLMDKEFYRLPFSFTHRGVMKKFDRYNPFKKNELEIK